MIAMIEVTSSGNDVPRATTETPIINSDIPNDLAIVMALSTSSSEP